MRLLEEQVTRTVSIIEQVLELPLNSVVLAVGSHGVYDVLLRTGQTGWMSTNRASVLHSPYEDRYKHEAFVRAWVEHHEGARNRLFVLDRDEAKSIGV